MDKRINIALAGSLISITVSFILLLRNTESTIIIFGTTIQVGLVTFLAYLLVKSRKEIREILMEHRSKFFEAFGEDAYGD